MRQVIPKFVAFRSHSKLFRTFAHVEIRPSWNVPPGPPGAYMGTPNYIYYGTV